MPVDFKPEGFHSLTPNTIVSDADRAIAFYQEVFDAKMIRCLRGSAKTVVHCELEIGDSRLNLAEAMEGFPEHALMTQLFVADSDAVFARAVAAGAKVLAPVTDMFFGFREGRVLDPFGNTWTIATKKEVVSDEELQRRLNEHM